MFEQLERMSVVALSELTILTSGLSNVDRSRVMLDFEKGREYFTQILHIKLGHWQNLPHLCLGIAHFDADVARDTARQVLAKACSTLGSPGVHRLTKVLCTPGPAYM